jgi:periplasmic nitrate reductase NapD
VNISGVVVRTKAENVSEVMKKLTQSTLCEVYESDPSGKIIITIEGSSIKDETEKLQKIQSIEGVLSADMAYAYSEHDYEGANDLIKNK